MSLIQLFFRQTATIRKFVRYAAGEPIYGSPETRKCRIERGKDLKQIDATLRADGVANSEPANTRMYCTGTAIPLGSIVENDGKSYVVTDCKVLNGFRDDHLEVTLQ